MRIPRQVECAAPTAHQVRTITVQFTQQPDGSLGLRSQHAPGWGAIARTQDQLAKSVHEAFVETQVAAYSRWKGEVYDRDDTGEKKPPRRRVRRTGNGIGYGQGQPRPDVHPLEAWKKKADGDWLSPSGRTYRAGTAMVQRIEANRKKNGLPH